MQQTAPVMGLGEDAYVLLDALLVTKESMRRRPDGSVDVDVRLDADEGGPLLRALRRLEEEDGDDDERLVELVLRVTDALSRSRT